MNRNTEQMGLSPFTASHLLFRLTFRFRFRKWNTRLLTAETQRNKIKKQTTETRRRHGDFEESENQKNWRNSRNADTTLTNRGEICSGRLLCYGCSLFRCIP